MHRIIAIAAAVVAAMVGPGVTSATAETTLKAISSLPPNNPRAKAFVSFFIEKLNADAKGTVQINFLGGPEVVPSSKGASAVQRGVTDILYSPIAYYSGQVPEGHALEVSNAPREVIYSNGAMAALDAIWNRRINAHILGWGSYGTQYNLYLMQPPKFRANGLPDLSGLKVRSNETYRPIVTGLGATPVSVAISEIYTALQRGVVDGFAFPNSGLLALGVERMVKYRINPSFYRGANLILVNLDKWKSLGKAEKDALDAAARHFEREDDAFVAKIRDDEAGVLAKHGMKVVTLQGAAAKAYLKIAYDGLWARVAERSKEAAALRPKLYQEE